MRKSHFRKGIMPLVGLVMILFTTATSAQMTKVVLSGPTITPGTRVMAKNEGDAIGNTELKVTVTGGYTPGTVYVWKKDGIIISGATAANYALNVLTTTDAGTYTCTVTRANSSTDPTTVTMDADSVCILQVSNANITQVPFKSPLYRSGARPPFTIYTPGTVTNVSESNLNQTLGKITAIDTAAYGYTKGPVTPGSKASSARWFRNGVEINGSTPGFTASDFTWAVNQGPTLALTTSNTKPSTDPNGDQYYCILTNSKGSTTTDAFNVAIVSSTAVPTVTQIDSKAAPADPTTIVYDTMFLGSTIDFLNINASNALTYQWYRGAYPNGTAINGAIGSKYVPASGIWTAADADTYYLKMVNGSTASSPSALSNPIQIAVLDPAVTKTITIVTNPKDLTMAEGDTLKLSIVASIVKQGNNSYQWYANGNRIPSGSGSDLALALTSVSDTGTYYCKMYNEVDSLTSATVRVTMTREPIPLFNNLADVYDGVNNLLSPRMEITVKGVLSETLTTWQAVDSKGTIIPLTMDEIASRQTHRLYSVTGNSALPVGKYTIRVTNADGTLVVEKAVEIK